MFKLIYVFISYVVYPSILMQVQIKNLNLKECSQWNLEKSKQMLLIKYSWKPFYKKFGLMSVILKTNISNKKEH